MAPSLYSPLPTDTFTIRLLQLLPSADPSSDIHCNLVTYPISTERTTAHLYECLSYVWGSPANPERIFVSAGHVERLVEFQVTRNLYVALKQLRDAHFPRYIWVDAICINQLDDEEKAQQVAAMARIYGLAQRVVAWLGEEGEHSAWAFQALKVMALKSDNNGSLRYSDIREVQTRHPDDPCSVENDKYSHVGKSSSNFSFQRICIRQLLTERQDGPKQPFRSFLILVNVFDFCITSVHDSGLLNKHS